MSDTKPPFQNTYEDQAISIRALAAQAKSADAQAQLLHIAAMYDKLAHLLRDAAVHSLITMASTLQGDATAAGTERPRVDG